MSSNHVEERRIEVKIKKQHINNYIFRAYLTVVDGLLMNNSFILPKHCVNPDFKQPDFDVRTLGEIKLSYMY